MYFILKFDEGLDGVDIMMQANGSCIGLFDWGFCYLIVVKLIAGNLICLELLTGLDVGLMALTSTLRSLEVVHIKWQQ